jgi:hypothetical protein
MLHLPATLMMSNNLEEVVFIIYYYHYVLKISKRAFNPNSNFSWVWDGTSNHVMKPIFWISKICKIYLCLQRV